MAKLRPGHRPHNPRNYGGGFPAGLLAGLKRWLEEFDRGYAYCRDDITGLITHVEAHGELPEEEAW